VSAASKAGVDTRRARKRPARRKRAAAPRRRYTALGLRKARAIVDFARTHLIHVDGELPPNGVAFEPIELEGFQLENIILPIIADVDRTGRRRKKKAIVGLPRDGAKSEIAAVIVLAIAFLEPKFKGQYYFVARDKEQARAVFDKVSTMVLHDPLLRRACDVLKDQIVIKETKAKFQVLPGDEKSVQGKHADVCIIDEYHVHRSDAILNAMTSGMIGNWDHGALLFVISTAGPERRGPLWELLAKWKDDPSAYIYWCGAEDEDDGHDPEVWRKANPMPWVSDAALAEAYRTLPFWEFERYHLNRFPKSGVSRAYPAALWHAGAAAPEFEEDRQTILGLDASWTRDSTALVMVQRDKVARLHAWAQVWRKDGALGHIDHEAVEAKILDLCETYNVVRIACDQNYFTRSMLKLEHEFRLPIEEFPQDSRRMSQASMTLYDVIQEGRILHGAAADLTDQVLNAGVKATPYGWRITKVEQEQKIDAAVALAIAVYLAEAGAAPSAPSFAQTGGIYSISLG
jgi:phage terminase large subunit-like protein